MITLPNSYQQILKVCANEFEVLRKKERKKTGDPYYETRPIDDQILLKIENLEIGGMTIAITSSASEMEIDVEIGGTWYFLVI